MASKEELKAQVTPDFVPNDDFYTKLYGYSVTDKEYEGEILDLLQSTGHDNAYKEYMGVVDTIEGREAEKDKNVGEWLIDQKGKTTKKKKKPKDPLFEMLEPFHTFNDKGQPNGTYDDKIAQYIIDNHHLMFLDSAPYIYDNGVYAPDKNGMSIKQLIKAMIFDKFKKSRTINGIYTLIQENPTVNRSMNSNSPLPGINKFPDTWVNFENGMLDLKTMQMHQHSPAYYSINQIPHKWEPNASYKGTIAYKFICGLISDSDDRQMLYVMVGYWFTIRNDIRKALAFLGPPKTGKSTLMNFIIDVIGKNNVSNLPFHMIGQRFQSVTLIGKTLNVSNDMSKKEIEDDSIFKQLTGGDMLPGEYKNGESFSFEPYSKVAVVCNELPKNINDTTGAFFNRFLIIKIMQQTLLLFSENKHIITLTEPNTPLNDADHVGYFNYCK